MTRERTEIETREKASNNRIGREILTACEEKLITVSYSEARTRDGKLEEIKQTHNETRERNKGQNSKYKTREKRERKTRIRWGKAKEMNTDENNEKTRNARRSKLAVSPEETP